MNLRDGLSWVGERVKRVIPYGRDSSRQAFWPGIKGRSEEHEGRTETGVPPREQADVTQAQRDLEKQVHH